MVGNYFRLCVSLRGLSVVYFKESRTWIAEREIRVQENWHDDDKYLESCDNDDDAELLLKTPFAIHVKVSALIIKGPPEKGKFLSALEV